MKFWRLRPQVDDGPEQISVSVGLAMLQPGVSADALIEQADQALYRAKARGRNRVEVAGEERRSKPSTIIQKQVDGKAKQPDAKPGGSTQADTK